MSSERMLMLYCYKWEGKHGYIRPGKSEEIIAARRLSLLLMGSDIMISLVFKCDKSRSVQLTLELCPISIIVISGSFAMLLDAWDEEDDKVIFPRVPHVPDDGCWEWLGLVNGKSKK